MKKLILIFVIILLVIIVFVCYFWRTDNVKTNDVSLRSGVLVLQIPEIDVPAIRRCDSYSAGQEIVSSRDIITIEFSLIDKNNKFYLRHASQKFIHMSIFNMEPWRIPERQSFENYSEKWNITIADDENNIYVDGFLACEFFILKYELSAVKQKPGVWVGTGMGSYCATDHIPEPYRRIIQINWRMFLKDQKEEVIDNTLKVFKLLRDWPETKPQQKIQQTEDEINEKLRKEGELSHRLFLHRPLLNQTNFREGKKHPKDKLHGVVISGSGDQPRQRLICARDKIIPEIAWEEIGNLPGALFLLDHLATVEANDVCNRILQGEYDESGKVFIDQDLKKLTKSRFYFYLFIMIGG